jgi:C-terminal processing protease CtpA/Prc
MINKSTWPTKKRPYVGIAAVTINEELQVHFGAPKGVGLLVARVEPKSPARKAGVRVGDVLVALDGHEMRSLLDVVSAIYDRKKGDRIKLRLIRAGKPLTLYATLDVRKKPQVEVADFLIRMRVPSLGSVKKATDEHLKRFRQQERELKRRLREMERKLHRLERDLPASP